jgi:hypothetical protein
MTRRPIHMSSLSAVSSVPVDERIRVMRELAGDVPVAIDRTGWLRYGIALQYVSESNGMIRPTAVVIGAEARMEDIIKYRDIVIRVSRYNEAIEEIRILWQRIGALLEGDQIRGDALQSAQRALVKFDELVASRRADRMGNGFASPEVLGSECRFLERLHEEHVMAVARAERVRRLDKPRTGP